MGFFEDDGERMARAAGHWAAWAVSRCGRRDLFEDWRQELLMHLWENRGRYDPARGAPATFVAAVCRRKALMLLRALAQPSSATTWRAGRLGEWAAGLPAKPENEPYADRLRRERREGGR